MGDALQLAIKTVAPVAYKHLLDFAAGRNVTEVAKKEDCWMSFRDTKIDLPPLVGDLENAGSGARPVTIAGVASQVTRLSSAELQEKVRRVKLDVWLELTEWGAHEGRMLPWQITICRTLHGKLKKDIRLKPDESRGLLDVLEASRAKGFHG